MKKAYLSDVSPWWTMERQEAALHDFMRGATVFRDTLSPRQRRAHQVAVLVQRALMLRPTTRSSGGTIYVASLSVLAWEEGDILAVYQTVQERGATLVSIDDGGIVGANVVELWKAARIKSRIEGASRRGAAISGANREAAAKAAVAKIKSRWPLPNSEHSTKALLEEAGIVYNTAIKYLGRRPIAQHRYATNQKRRKT